MPSPKTDTVTAAGLVGILTPQLLHLLCVAFQEASYDQPFETVEEAREQLMETLHEAYDVIQHSQTLVLVQS